MASSRVKGNHPGLKQSVLIFDRKMFRDSVLMVKLNTVLEAEVENGDGKVETGDGDNGREDHDQAQW